ncbi:BUD22 family protein [Aspergillus stella-maris]|uniref:BUD22 family protein n=1 Tax=Aspergillus stella-maris TaxID=1810926 RepID=UPI003CCD5869
MPKRKLSDRDANPDSQAHSHSQSKSLTKPDAARAAENKEIKLQTARLKHQFDFGVTSLSRALKAARISERQKLGRRQKEVKVPAGAEDDAAVRNSKYKKGKGKMGGKSKKGDVDPEEAARRIEGEIAVLKTLDPTKCAEKYLFKQLAKTKRIEETQVFYRFKQAKKLTVEAPKSTEEANVTARLFMSQPVKNVLPGIMERLKALFALDKESGKKVKKGTGKATENDEEQAQREVSIPVSDDEDDAGDEDIEMEDTDGNSDSEEDYSAFDARLAPDSDEEEESEDDALTRPQIRRSSMSITPSPEPSPEPSISLSASRTPSPPPTKKPKPTGKEPKAPATSTTFLPSLMMGGYWSGSENEESDVDAENAADDIAPKRKNRMGQQARRALWEKKYGAGAKHVKETANKKGNKKGKGRDSGWDLRKGATGDGDGSRSRFGTGSNSMAVTGERRFGGASAGAGDGGKDAKKKADANKPLHPSWEAARKAKEAKATAAFSGKKVVFD